MTKTIKGSLIFESPVYRGNSKKTIFTRGNSKNEISLPGEISGSAKAMMSAFTGFWQHPKNPRNNNYGLIEQLWKRLFAEDMPNFISNVSCTLDQQIAESEQYFDLRMGIAIDRDRMAQAEDQNFRLETVYKGSRFNFSLSFNENRLKGSDKIKFAYLLEEMIQGRFWFGAQKSTGMGKSYLKLDKPSQDLLSSYKNTGNQKVQLNNEANYVFITLDIVPDSPLLVSWPWGNKDEQGNRDAWIDDLRKETEEHKNIMDNVLAGHAKNWSDVEKMPGGIKFKNNHLRSGQPMSLDQLKRNFTKAVRNDETLMDFLKGHRGKVHKEIDREPHLDFREEKGEIIRGKPYDQLFYRALTRDQHKTCWELCIPGNTIKGAFRTKAQQILRTLHNGQGCKEKTSSHEGKYCDDRYCPVCSLFGRQGMTAEVFCSDAYLAADDKLPDDEQYSYDQITVDPKTGQSIENSKLNFLFAYGQKFSFKCSLVLKDLDPRYLEQFSFLIRLLKEFENGTIPFGGKKTSGFGYIRGKIDKMEFLCPPGSSMENQLKKWKVKKTGFEQLWHHYELDGGKIWKNNKFTSDIQKAFSKLIGEINTPEKPFKTKAGYISHRQYSKLCGSLICELEALTPIHIRESGEPSFQGEEVFGYDFFSISPPKNSKKQPIDNREYAVPPSTLKGETRKIYNLISKNPCSGCKHINKLCDTCRLFGWVGTGNNKEQALMGRINFSLARPVDNIKFEWFGVEFGYKGEKSSSISGVRIFPHTNNISKSISRYGTSDMPVDVEKNRTLNRFAKTGSKFRFQVDFTNLEKEELKKLIWALELEDGLAHKIGKSKALYFGSCKIRITEAYLIDWAKRFSSLDDLGQVSLDLDAYRPDKSDLANYDDLKKALSLPG